jgi:hypothetical protein
MQEAIKTYPETRRKSWEVANWTHAELIPILIRERNQGKGNTRRIKSYNNLIEAIDALAERRPNPVTVFKGPKVKELFIAAARDAEWFVEPKTFKERFKAPTDIPEGFKFCRGCKETKPKLDFNAEATPAQKKRNGWNVDSKRMTQSLLCSVCRPKKKRRDRIIEAHHVAKQLAKKDDRDVRLVKLSKLRTSYQAAADRIAVTFNKVKRTLYTPDGDVHEYQFKTPAIADYYHFKREMIRKVGTTLREASEDFSVAAQLPDSGLWQDALTQDERDRIERLYNLTGWLDNTYKSSVVKMY